jgi:RNA polymerase subunit RPABC4/transcription elongation factor Spt4
MYAIYTCGHCGRSVTKTTRVCPHCGARLAGIKCQSCGFVGSETDFAGDRCPKCRSVVRVSSQKSSQSTCKKCGRSMESGEITCSHCGHTNWGTIVIAGMIALGLLSGIWWGLEEPVCTGAAVVVGGVMLLVTISWVHKASKTP